MFGVVALCLLFVSGLMVRNHFIHPPPDGKHANESTDRNSMVNGRTIPKHLQRRGQVNKTAQRARRRSSHVSPRRIINHIPPESRLFATFFFIT